MNAKELAAKVRRIKSPAFPIVMRSELNDLAEMIATDIELLVPRYRPPQPEDDGKYCYLEQLPSDAPPTLVRRESWRPGSLQRVDNWQYWTISGWRDLTGNVWPCERPEVANCNDA